MEEVKALLKTGEFSISALNKINNVKDIFAFGNKLTKVDGVTILIDDVGRVIVQGENAMETFLHVKYMPKGARPLPSTYLEADYITNHLSKFDDRVVRISTREKYILYGTYGGNEAYVMPKSEFDKIWIETGEISGN